MSAPRSDDSLADAAQMYYVDDLSQQQIAKRLQTTRSNVSRMLIAARERGIVRFHIARSLPRNARLEYALRNQFNLREAVVLSAEAGADELDKIGQLGAQWLTENLQPGNRLALTWGRTLQAVVQAYRADQPLDIEVVQAGGDLQVDPQFSGHELVRTLAARAGARYSYLHAPAILDTSEMAATLRDNKGIARELDRARASDVALVGIGAFGTGFSARLLESAMLNEHDRKVLDAMAPAGDVCARFFDADGTQLDTPLRDRVLALELDELCSIPTVVGIAGGAEKAAGVLAALRGGLLDVVITDQAVAAEALHRQGSSTVSGPA